MKPLMKIESDLDIAARRARQFNEGSAIDDEIIEEERHHNLMRGLLWSIAIGVVMFGGLMCLGYAAIQLGRIFINWIGL